jgi:hypothetical protein
MLVIYPSSGDIRVNADTVITYPVSSDSPKSGEKSDIPASCDVNVKRPSGGPFVSTTVCPVDISYRLAIYSQRAQSLLRGS